MTLLDVESLTKRYGSIVAVDDLSFSVAPGGTLGLLGPNGAGKTTTMGCIVGLLEPDGGQVAVDGLAPKSKPVSAMVGYAAQRTALYLSLRVSENLAYFGGLYGCGAGRWQRRWRRSSTCSTSTRSPGAG